MKLQRLKIRNILGIEDLEIDTPGAVTVISGGNGAGKTSVIEAVKAILGGGHDATLLRHGADEGEAVLVLEDGTEIEKKVTAAGSKLNVRHPEFGRVTAPQTWINGLIDAVALDPAAFLAADGAGRVRMLLEAWPVQVTETQLREAIGPTVELPPVLSSNALDAVAQVRKSVYDERTGVNRTVKEKEATATQLTADLPDGDEEEHAIAGRLSDLRDKQANGERALVAKTEGIRSGRDARKERIRNEAAAEIRRIEQERDRSLEEADRDAHAEREKVELEYRPALKRLEGEISRLEERSRHAAAHAQTRRTAAQMRAEAEQARMESEQLTAALDRLDALREQLAAQIPIDGVEIEDGEVLIDRIPFPRLNHAAQIETSVQLAAKRAGKLGIACVDGLEALDPDAWSKLLETMEEAGLQAFVTRVTAGPLAVGGAG